MAMARSQTRAILIGNASFIDSLGGTYFGESFIFHPSAPRFAYESTKDSSHSPPFNGRHNNVGVDGIAGSEPNLPRLDQNMLQRALVLVMCVNGGYFSLLHIHIGTKEN
jgi:hypothetical protein